MTVAMLREIARTINLDASSVAVRMAHNET
jgi:hypothetical protein